MEYNIIIDIYYYKNIKKVLINIIFLNKKQFNCGEVSINEKFQIDFKNRINNHKKHSF